MAGVVVDVCARPQATSHVTGRRREAYVVSTPAIRSHTLLLLMPQPLQLSRGQIHVVGLKVSLLFAVPLLTAPGPVLPVLILIRRLRSNTINTSLIALHPSISSIPLRLHRSPTLHLPRQVLGCILLRVQATHTPLEHARGQPIRCPLVPPDFYIDRLESPPHARVLRRHVAALGKGRARGLRIAVVSLTAAEAVERLDVGRLPVQH